VIPAEIVPQNKAQKELFLANGEGIRRLAGVAFDLVLEASTSKKAVTALIDGSKIIVPLEGIIDFEVEKKRKNEEIKQKQKLIEGLQSRLSNEAFISKAPEDVILKEKERLDAFNKEALELKNDLADLL
jgi:valyl-tRNA synthetase